jgi:hypothetical protein
VSKNTEMEMLNRSAYIISIGIYLQYKVTNNVFLIICFLIFHFVLESNRIESNKILCKYLI